MPIDLNDYNPIALLKDAKKEAHDAGMEELSTLIKAEKMIDADGSVKNEYRFFLLLSQADRKIELFKKEALLERLRVGGLTSKGLPPETAAKCYKQCQIEIDRLFFEGLKSHQACCKIVAKRFSQITGMMGATRHFRVIKRHTINPKNYK